MKIREAAPAPFAVGEFELITERIADGTVASSSTSLRKLVKLGDQSRLWESPEEGRVPPNLELCRGCDSYIWPGESTCPHCGADVQAAAAQHQEDSRRRAAVMADMERILGEVAAIRATAISPQASAL